MRLTLEGFIDCLSEPLKYLGLSFAIKKGYLDIENAKKRIYFIFSACGLSIFCPRESFIDVELGERVLSKRYSRDSRNLVDLLL
jgi:hypothetical protein